MRGYAEDRIPDSDVVRLHLSQCIDCRACETVCPSGVRYGEMIEFVRSEMEASRPSRGLAARSRSVLLRQLFASPGRLRLAFAALRAVEALGLRHLARFLRILPRRIALLDSMFPPVPPAVERAPISGVFPAIGERRARVALFTGCVMEQMFGRVNRATLHVLRRNGCEVVVPATQVCCGALHVHNGQADDARALARKNMAAFPGDVDAIVMNSAGCGAALKDLPHLLPEAESFAKKVKDVSEVLADLGPLPPPRAIQRRVAYDDPCHLCHAQGIRREPRKVLAAISGLELVPLRDSEMCCGAGGIYNLVHTEISMKVLELKVRAIAESRADVVATGNPGCILQISAGVRRAGLPVAVVHPIELLAAAYG
jgi:glycolate oxidase iron-sulfur subunit